MMRKMLVMFCVIAALAVSAVSPAIYADTTSPSVVNVASKSFDTPEHAVNWFVSSIAGGDFPGAMSACMINEADGFDFAAYSKWLNMISPWQSPAPANGDMLRQLNRVQRLAMLSGQIKIMIYSLLTDLTLDGSVIGPVSDETIESTMKQLDIKRLSTLTVVKIRLPIDRETFSGERAKSNMKRNAAFYGGDDSTERIVLYKLDGAYFWGGVHLIRFGKNWKIDGLSSSFAGSGAMGNLEKTTMEAFDAIGDEIK